jgi:hypothetical protein
VLIKHLAVNKLASASIISLIVLAGAAARDSARAAGAEEDSPRYTATGELQVPAQYREWVFLTSGVDMNYKQVAVPGHSTFDNVFVTPGSYRSFLKSGTWPDRTIFMLEIRAATSAPTSINKNGQTQSERVVARELHVKDARLEGGWGFFAVADSGMGIPIKRPAECYECHEAHAAVDTTFTQFYPTLLPVAKAKGSLSPGYLRDEKVEQTSR